MYDGSAITLSHIRLLFLHTMRIAFLLARNVYCPTWDFSHFGVWSGDSFTPSPYPSENKWCFRNIRYT